MTKQEKIERAYDLLREARNLLREAEAPKTLARVRLALTSCQGAIRNASAEPYRMERKMLEWAERNLTPEQ